MCFSLKKQKESEAVEIKKSALEDSSNETSDDEHKKERTDKTELNHTKANKSSVSVKKNPLQNTAKLGRCIKYKNSKLNSFYYFNIIIIGVALLYYINATQKITHTFLLENRIKIN